MINIRQIDLSSRCVHAPVVKNYHYAGKYARKIFAYLKTVHPACKVHSSSAFLAIPLRSTIIELNRGPYIRDAL